MRVHTLGVGAGSVPGQAVPIEDLVVFQGPSFGMGAR